MLKDPALYCCPYCHDNEGVIWLDSFACMEARREDPGSRFLYQAEMEAGQPFIRFGPRGERRLPCRHVLDMGGEISFRLMGADDGETPNDGELNASTWALTFEWMAAPLARLHPYHRGVWMRDYPKIRAKAPAFLTQEKCRLDELHGEWDVVADWVTSFGCVYEIHAKIFAAQRPTRFVKELKVRAELYAAHLAATAGNKKP